VSRRHGRQLNYAKRVVRTDVAARNRLRATEARRSREHFGRRATTTRKDNI
jgi:hypothetical protein